MNMITEESYTSQNDCVTAERTFIVVTEEDVRVFLSVIDILEGILFVWIILFRAIVVSSFLNRSFSH